MSLSHLISQTDVSYRVPVNVQAMIPSKGNELKGRMLKFEQSFRHLAVSYRQVSTLRIGYPQAVQLPGHDNISRTSCDFSFHIYISMKFEMRAIGATELGRACSVNYWLSSYMISAPDVVTKREFSGKQSELRTPTQTSISTCMRSWYPSYAYAEK
jgi:hypothetical protein